MTMYGNQHYNPDPLPIQRPIYNQETIGEIKIASPSLTEPLAHSGIKPPLDDNLLSASQRAIIKSTDDILTVLSSPCRCDHCKNGVMVILSDLLSETMTEMTIASLNFALMRRSFDNLRDDIKRLLEARR